MIEELELALEKAIIYVACVCVGGGGMVNQKCQFKYISHIIGVLLSLESYGKQQQGRRQRI